MGYRQKMFFILAIRTTSNEFGRAIHANLKHAYHIFKHRTSYKKEGLFNGYVHWISALRLDEYAKNHSFHYDKKGEIMAIKQQVKQLIIDITPDILQILSKDIHNIGTQKGLRNVVIYVNTLDVALEYIVEINDTHQFYEAIRKNRQIISQKSIEGEGFSYIHKKRNMDQKRQVMKVANMILIAGLVLIFLIFPLFEIHITFLGALLVR